MLDDIMYDIDDDYEDFDDALANSPEALGYLNVKPPNLTDSQVKVGVTDGTISVMGVVGTAVNNTTTGFTGFVARPVEQPVETTVKSSTETPVNAVEFKPSVEQVVSVPILESSDTEEPIEADLSEEDETAEDDENSTGEFVEDDLMVNDQLVSFDVEAPEVHDEEPSPNEVVSLNKKSDGIDYPFLLLEADNLTQHKIVALQSMLSSGPRSEYATMYSVYLRSNGSILKIGETTNYALKSILTSEVFQDFKKYIKLDENRKIEGTMMFALCGVNI